jgi:hypothetical protein
MSSAEEQDDKRLRYKRKPEEEDESEQEEEEEKKKAPAKKKSKKMMTSSASAAAASAAASASLIWPEVPSTPTMTLPIQTKSLFGRSNVQLKPLSHIVRDFRHRQNSKATGRPICLEAAKKSDVSHGRGGYSSEMKAEKEEEEEDDEEKKEAAAVPIQSLSSPSPEDVMQQEVEAMLGDFDRLRQSPTEVASMHVKQAAVKVWTNENFLEARAKCPPPSYFSESDYSRQATTEVIQRQLRIKQLELIPLTAQHESKLLAEAGTFSIEGKQYYFPPCENKENCFASKGNPLIMGLKHPIVLMGFMFEHEYKLFLENNNNDRDDPPYAGQRPCILCCRYYPIVHCLNVRQQAMRGKAEGFLVTTTTTNSSQQQQPHTKKAVQIVQCYRNLEDTEGGYHRSFMFHPKSEEPIIQPIVRACKERLRAYQDGGGGRWMIDQSALIFHKPVVHPPIGKSLQCF